MESVRREGAVETRNTENIGELNQRAEQVDAGQPGEKRQPNPQPRADISACGRDNALIPNRGS